MSQGGRNMDQGILIATPGLTGECLLNWTVFLTSGLPPYYSRPEIILGKRHKWPNTLNDYGWKGLTWDHEVNGVTWFWPHLCCIPKKAIASECSIVVGSSSIQTKSSLWYAIGLVLWVQCPWEVVFSFLDQNEFVKSHVWATGKGDGNSRSHIGAGPDRQAGIFIRS